MSKLWHAGRESYLLDEMIAGRKTIEGRLNRGKFAEYRVGDTVALRRDYRDADGTLHNGEPGQARAVIVAIRQYHSFLEMVQAEDYERVIPTAQSAEEAAGLYDKYYSAANQARHGVLAIEVTIQHHRTQ